MICPTCKDSDQKSTVRHLWSYTTLLWSNPWYDDEGNYHSHDPNRTTSGFRCSNGHEIRIKGRSPCPQGDYDTETEITIS